MTELPPDSNLAKSDTIPEWTTYGSKRKKYRFKKKKKKRFSKSKFKKSFKKILNILIWIFLISCFVVSLIVLILNIDVAKKIK